MRYHDTETKRCYAYYRYNSESEKLKYNTAVLDLVNRFDRKFEVSLVCDRGADSTNLNVMMRAVMSHSIDMIITVNIAMLGSCALIAKTHLLTLLHMGVEIITISDVPLFVSEELILRGIKEYNSIGPLWENEYGHFYDLRKREPHAGNFPLGYKRDFDGTIVINEYEADIVRKVFGMFISGMSYREITLKLLDESGLSFSESTIRNILSNRRYCGRKPGEEGTFPPLVMNGLWMRACDLNSKSNLTVYADVPIYLKEDDCFIKPCNSKGTIYKSLFSNVFYETKFGDFWSTVTQLISFAVDNRREMLFNKVVDYSVKEREKLREILEKIERSIYLDSAYLKTVLDNLSLLEIEKIRKLKLKIENARMCQIRAKLDYIQSCAEIDSITEFFERIKQYALLGSYEKRFFTGVLVRKIEVHSDALEIHLVDGSTYRQNNLKSERLLRRLTDERNYIR